MAIPNIRVDREQMMQRVARFADLTGYDGGLPDSHYPGCERTLYNVLGFQPPEGDDSVVSPVGAQAAALAGTRIQEGFHIGYADDANGKGGWKGVGVGKGVTVRVELGGCWYLNNNKKQRRT